MFELTVTPAFGIYAGVKLTIDTTNADDVDASLTALESSVADDWGEVETETVFITSAPSSTPSSIPSLAPITLQPSAQPSITGLVVTIDVKNLFSFSVK